MALVAIIDTLVVCILIGTACTKGFERMLPVAAFLLLLFPNECQFRLPGLFEITTQRVMVVVLAILFATLGKTKRQQNVPLRYLLCMQIGWMLVSTLNSVVFTVSFKAVVSQLFDYFLPFYILSRSVTKLETIHNILTAFVNAISVCCIFGAVEAYGYGSIVSVFPAVAHTFSDNSFVVDRGVRASATFGHSILFGAAISLAIPMALYLLTRPTTSGRRAMLSIGTILMFLNVYKTGSRGAWMATVMSITLLLLFGYGRVRKYAVGIVLLSVTVLVIRPGVWETINNNYVATLDPDSPQGSSYQWRYALYGIAQRELSKDVGRALWGYGPESFVYLNLEGDFQGRIVPFQSCDSSIAAILIETGYVGLIIVLIILVKGLRMSFVSFRRTRPPDNLLPLVFAIDLLAFCFFMSNVALFGWGQQNYMFWAVLSFGMAYPRLARLEAVARRSGMATAVPTQQPA